MGSIKCTLRKEVKNEINKYIDNEFITEMIKEIINYIRTTHKVKIDDSEFDKEDAESKVILKDDGPFNIYDYMYVKDFLYELSWEGSYIKELKESEYSDNSKGRSKYIPQKITEDSEVLYKYIPKDIATVLYEKVEASMEIKKGQLYKEFKKKYNEEFLFNSVRWYKRSRDGKIYCDIDLNEIDENKKIRLEEQIKTEIGNSYKTRWGNDVVAKVISLDNKLLLDIYDEGCKILGIKNEYSSEVIEADNSKDEEKIIKLMLDNYKEATKLSKGINKLKVKVINSFDKKIDDLINMNVYKTNEHMKLFLNDAREMIFGYYKSVNLPGFRKTLIDKEYKINKLIERVAVVENIIYKNYLEKNPSAPSIEDMEFIKECLLWICTKGLLWTSENIYIKSKVKDEIKEIILDNPIGEYKEARDMKRHFYLHVGETNTGKTYASIQRLMDAETGVYLAPLRLLALEIQDKLNSQNISCSLLTGEEEDIKSYASHVSSTIEKLSLGTNYDVCVIDEAQMIADKQRGWAWTRAIIGVLSPEIHICMAPEAKDIIIKLIKDCNDTYEIINHKRNTKLIFEEKKFELKNDVKKGDALVVFGKKKALAVSAELLNNNIKTSIIYGSLPYSTRKKQFERFLDGETDVIVCTDAIGMGVNLPIKRIVFLETRKFDGISQRKLKVSEIKQIAGRAGRKGIYEKGYVATTADSNLIKSALTSETKKIEKCYIEIPDSLLELDIDIIDALKTWSLAPVKGYFQKPDVTTIIFLLNRLKDIKVKASKSDLLKMATIPFEENNKRVLALWEEYCTMYSQGAVNLKRPKLNEIVNAKKELDELECYYKSLELNYSFGKNFKLITNNGYISSEKENTANKINELLLTTLLQHERVCLDCKKKLAWDYPSERCRACKEKLQLLKGDRFRPSFRGGRRTSDFRNKRNRRSYY
ncbi:helicase-related protein [Clostridium chauvoei]|uniref:helicase-related protein n=1 Tax=Clostridium chauvoei TaxID=46867 RepID=UPI001C8612CA|nr:DEAD/DEAH box helicase [Clostridium chauvoei]MBX7367811.1 RNA helicase [Clostridium chauvoei]MBX7382244.1 RNA helicase [Clostridium chauvoei]MBX7390490.1 RNA helicase [Clostridium chauvoei]